jgi:hypothetical protein
MVHRLQKVPDFSESATADFVLIVAVLTARHFSDIPLILGNILVELLVSLGDRLPAIILPSVPLGIFASLLPF